MNSSSDEGDSKDEQEGNLQGALSVAEKYKSNSLLPSFPSWFREFTAMEEAVSQQVQYYGNTSDLWGFFKFNLKAEINSFSKPDLRLLKRVATAAQLSTFKKACQKITNPPLKALMQAKEQGLLSKHQSQIQRSDLGTELPLPKQEQELYLSVSNSSELAAGLQALSEDPTSQAALSLYEFAIHFFIKRKSSAIKAGQQQKRRSMMRLLGFHLAFTIHNESWKKIVLSKVKISELQLRVLAEPNGASKLIRFYQDAPEQALKKQLEVSHKMVKSSS